MYNEWVTNKKGPWHRIESALSLQVNMYSELNDEIWKKRCRERKLSVSAIKGQFLRNSTHWAKSIQDLLSHSLSQGSHNGAPKETHQDSFSFGVFCGVTSHDPNRSAFLLQQHPPIAFLLDQYPTIATALQLPVRRSHSSSDNKNDWQRVCLCVTVITAGKG